MENASKALLIAGGVFIAIVILSTAIYLYTSFSNQTKEYDSIMSATELQKFNSKFDVYIGRNNITAQEMSTIINLAKEYNNSVEIIIQGQASTILTLTPENFIKKFLNSTFSCSNVEYSQTGKIEKLIFTVN